MHIKSEARVRNRQYYISRGNLMENMILTTCYLLKKKKKKNNMLQESKAQLFHHPLYLHAICAHSACEISKKSKNQLQEQMATKAGSLGNIYRRFKPQLLMVLAQIGYTFLYFITEASFNHGMNPHVYITYRHIVAGVVMFPFAYFLERYVYIFPFYIISVRR